MRVMIEEIDKEIEDISMKIEELSAIAGGMLYEYIIKKIRENLDLFVLNSSKKSEHSNGWIPVEERLPESDKYIMLSFSNFSIPAIGRYEEDSEGGAFYIGDEDASCVNEGLFVNAWQSLPEPYREKGE